MLSLFRNYFLIKTTISVFLCVAITSVGPAEVLAKLEV